MKQIEHTVIDTIGLHARPAGLLAKKAKAFKSSIELTYNNKTIDAKKLFAIMSLAVKNGEKIVLTISGEDEDLAYAELLKLCESV